MKLSQPVSEMELKHSLCLLKLTNPIAIHDI